MIVQLCCNHLKKEWFTFNREHQCYIDLKKSSFLVTLFYFVEYHIVKYLYLGWESRIKCIQTEIQP